MVKEAEALDPMQITVERGLGDNDVYICCLHGIKYLQIVLSNF